MGTDKPFQIDTLTENDKQELMHEIEILASYEGLRDFAKSGTDLNINSDVIRVRTAKTPASATDTGNAGDICWDANYIYVCIAANTWKRSALSTW